MKVLSEHKENVNKERVKLWVDALRSGEFKQGKQCLMNDEGEMCCLGVATMVYQKETGDGLWSEDPDRVRSDLHAYTFNYDDGGVVNETWDVLPHSVRHWYGFELSNPSLEVKDPHGDGLMGAAVLNDEYDKTFEEIADLVEATYLK